MRKPTNKVLMTTFGTALLEVNITEGLFKVKEDVTVPIDTPIDDYKGQKKTFLKGSTVTGNLWSEMDKKNNKMRKVVMVQDDNGRYLINKSVLEPTTQSEEDSKSELSKLGDKVEDLLSTAKEEATDIIKDPKSFLDKEYVGFTGKQILVATLGVIVLIKVFK